MIIPLGVAVSILLNDFPFLLDEHDPLHLKPCLIFSVSKKRQLQMAKKKNRKKTTLLSFLTWLRSHLVFFFCNLCFSFTHGLFFFPPLLNCDSVTLTWCSCGLAFIVMIYFIFFPLSPYGLCTTVSLLLVDFVGPFSPRSVIVRSPCGL